jgi:hypothetical protein
MFEHFSENARRVIFFAKYEAANMASPYVEPEHLLLGLLRQDKPLACVLLHSLDSIREKIKARPSANAKHSPGDDVPLTLESKRVLANAAMVAENRSERVDTAHILVGLLREEKSFAAELLREGLGNSNPPPFTFTLKAVNPRLTRANPSNPSGHHEGPAVHAALARSVHFENVTMAEFADRLPRIAPGYLRGGRVLDSTGLEGAWDFTLNFSFATPWKEPGTVTLFEAIGDQLGLRLEKIAGHDDPAPA